MTEHIEVTDDLVRGAVLAALASWAPGSTVEQDDVADEVALSLRTSVETQSMVEEQLAGETAAAEGWAL